MAQDLINAPPTRGAVDEQNQECKNFRVSNVWTAFFNQVFLICFAASQAGTTAQRPDSNLWIGRPYFDTTLGYAIWWAGTEWVDATGTTA